MAAEGGVGVQDVAIPLVASMGPRPFGRGRAGGARPLMDSPMRQWGRDRLAAEGPRSACASTPKRRVNGAATVWPRKGRDTVGVGDGDGASMGPRPFGRGRAAARTGRRCPGSGVNGAATVWPRKAAHGGSSLLRQPGVNGAATVWPRKVGVGGVGGSVQVASMGPRPFGRGRRSTTAAIMTARRGVNGAATVWPRKAWRARSSSSSSSCVNGAATVWPRKGLGRLPLVGAADASMGPRPFGRGRRPQIEAIHADLVASMGPRPFGRGRHLGLVRGEVAWQRASMGPRPFGRGRQDPRAPAARLPAASMGPRPFGRGRSR